MARPRIFVSSTYYDLKHIRASLDLFIESLGFESVLSEKGDIAYSHDTPLDESCYREVGTVDIFVIVVGGRYGSAASREERAATRLFYERYESVTKSEYLEAVGRDIPVYILVESGVYAEYQTYLQNKDNQSIKYAHVDSVNVFILLEEILERRRNNPVRPFDRFSEIESWLREQWSGLFRDLLHRRTTQQQLATLTDQVTALKDANETYRKYLEILVKQVSTPESERLIESESERLAQLELDNALKANYFVKYIVEHFDQTLQEVKEALRGETLADIRSKLPSKLRLLDDGLVDEKSVVLEDLNAARALMGLARLPGSSSAK